MGPTKPARRKGRVGTGLPVPLAWSGSALKTSEVLLVETAPPSTYEPALASLSEFFRDRQTRAGVVARRILGIPQSHDIKLTEQLVQERRRRTRLDGGVGGWVVATTWSAWELLQLGCPADHTGLCRMMGYLLARQDQPGRFGEGCSERRHKLGLCHHFVSGFFSPATKDVAVAPLAFPSGVVFTREWEARFGASCFALRTALQARQDRRESIRRHVDSLFHLAERWQAGQLPGSLDVAFASLGAVAMAPLAYRKRTDELFAYLAGQQQADGRWPNTSMFHAVDTLLLLPTPEARESVNRAVPAVVEDLKNQTGDESQNEDIALIALRALRSLGIRRPTPRPPRVSITSGVARNR